jgi:hypothetical protein
MILLEKYLKKRHFPGLFTSTVIENRKSSEIQSK